MLRNEKPYDFRKRMLTVNKSDVYTGDKTPSENQFELKSGMIVSIPEGDVCYTAASDFSDFCFRSMNTPILLQKNKEADITVSIDENYKGYKSYRIEIENDIKITAHDERGAAQALFALEEMMLTNHAPFLEKGITERSPLYSPRMTHSGSGSWFRHLRPAVPGSGPPIRSDAGPPAADPRLLLRPQAGQPAVSGSTACPFPFCQCQRLPEGQG